MAILPKGELFALLPAEVRDFVFEKHRIDHTQRLQNKAQAQTFVDDRGIVTLFSGTMLPSIQEAIAGELVTNAVNERYGAGYGIAWIWGRDFSADKQCVYGPFYREKGTLLAQRGWPSLAAVSMLDYRAARKSKNLSAAAFKMAAYIEENGPTRSDTLCDALGYSGRKGMMTFRKTRRELERHRAIIVTTYGDQTAGADTHVWDLTGRWLPDEVCEASSEILYQDAMANLIQICVESALVTEGDGVERWFGWARSLTSKTIDRLLKEERLFRVDGKIPLLISETILDKWPSA